MAALLAIVLATVAAGCLILALSASRTGNTPRSSSRPCSSSTSPD